MSKRFKGTTEVHQGTVLSQLLFVIVIDDFSDILKMMEKFMYFDNLVCFEYNWKQVEKYVK